MIRAAIALVAVLLGSMYAHAEESENRSTAGGLFVEPMVTYEVGSKTTVNWPAPFSDSTGSANGWGLGVRVGGHVGDVLFLAADGRYSMPTFKDSSVNYDASAKAFNYGATLGVQTPVAGLRVWGTYVFGGELDPEASGNYNVKLSNAQGYRIGAGLYVAVVSINLEYQDLKYKDVNLESFGGFPTNTNFGNVSVEDKAWIASVSFPIAM